VLLHDGGRAVLVLDHLTHTPAPTVSLWDSFNPFNPLTNKNLTIYAEFSPHSPLRYLQSQRLQTSSMARTFM
jgi:hypothetical protein